MANGYEKGDYLAQFLTQLPQIYQSNKNAELQRERFEYMKEEGFKDNVYRNQALTANQERNQLARDQFDQRKIQNDQAEAHRESVLKNATATQKYNDFNQDFDALAGNKEAQNYLLKSKFKGDQQMIDRINEHIDVNESMKHEIYSLGQLSPGEILTKGKRLLSSNQLDKESYDTINTTMKGARDQLQFTLAEFRGTKEFPEYLKLTQKMENPYAFLQAGEDVNTFLTGIGRQMEEVHSAAFKENQETYGPETTYDNVDIEAVNDKELDDYIADFSTPFTERYPYSPPEEGKISRAGGGLGFPIGAEDKPQAQSKEPLFVDDESGLDSIVKEYAPRAKLGFLEKAANEGSYLKPVTGELFNAIDGGLEVLDRADISLTGLTYPAVLANKPADFDQRYKKSSGEFKKSLKDMYNLYLRLDPKKGEYQTKFTTGNKRMRDKIKKKLTVYKSLGKRKSRGRQSAYRFDEEIQSILDRIEF